MVPQRRRSRAASPAGVWRDSAFVLLFGVLLYGLRFWRGSLGPGWLLHTLFTTRSTVLFPLIAWLSPALPP